MARHMFLAPLRSVNLQRRLELITRVIASVKRPRGPRDSLSPGIRVQRSAPGEDGGGGRCQTQRSESPDDRHLLGRMRGIRSHARDPTECRVQAGQPRNRTRLSALLESSRFAGTEPRSAGIPGTAAAVFATPLR